MIKGRGRAERRRGHCPVYTEVIRRALTLTLTLTLTNSYRDHDITVQPRSAFYWLVTLFLVSAIFRGAYLACCASLALLLDVRQPPTAAPPAYPAGFAPLTPAVGPYLGLLLVAVGIQEAARLALWRFHTCVGRRSAPSPPSPPPGPRRAACRLTGPPAPLPQGVPAGAAADCGRVGGRAPAAHGGRPVLARADPRVRAWDRPLLFLLRQVGLPWLPLREDGERGEEHAAAAAAAP